MNKKAIDQLKCINKKNNPIKLFKNMNMSSNIQKGN